VGAIEEMEERVKSIVITGSTRGIGYGLAVAFLKRSCNVTISGRTKTGVDQAIMRLCAEHDVARILGHPCDVTDFEQVQALWETAKAHWGRIDIWINNAGIAHPQMDFVACSAEQIRGVIETNLIGAMLGAKVALREMLAQGGGSFYNMEGLGSDGRKVKGLTLYGSTKCSLAYLTDALVEEVKGTEVRVGALRPGMVVTDMLTKQYEGRSADWESAKRIFNILADHVETVTPWLADRVLNNEVNGARFSWLTRGKVISRFLTAPFRRRDLFN
jgi:NAD(P)-dependent dehydrogenase (short-subunit alcohol dehydrogenase family)